ncbi:MAG: hypothetical protein KME29_04855 [Calothrix sp. FI2-JRJ7]|jgi:hypothetical protein|nr:hypothetical protein [Calothrix sp. FI2-JRJ7]
MNKPKNMFLRDKGYKSGSDLEMQSVRDVLRISDCTVSEVMAKTNMTREKVIICMKVLASEGVLKRRRNRYLVENL